MTPDPGSTAPSPLADAVRVMDRLRSPGGCAWDAEQTHASLARYLVEECYEVLEAIETEDAVLLREELGDLLLQVLFHARIALERPDGFGIDEVAGDLVAKLVRRHPHVFDAEVGNDLTAADLNETWEQRKIAEKGRTSVVEGVPIAQPALALASKLVSRGRRAGLWDGLSGSVPTDPSGAAAESADPESVIGDRLLAVVAEAVAAGVDPETALRRRARRLRDELVSREQAPRT